MSARHIVSVWARAAAVASSAVLVAMASDARADDADKAACIDMDEGEACVDSDGEPGTCVADESDPNVLSCEDSDDDDGGNSTTNSTNDNDDDDGCSIGGRAALAPAFALVLLGLWRRRR